MVSSSLDRFAPAPAPRHARDDDGAAPTGRHRRPESLADSAPAPFVAARAAQAGQAGGLRTAGADIAPIPFPPARPVRAGQAGGLRAAEADIARQRRTGEVRADTHHADEVIREARRAASRLVRAREDAAPARPGRRRAAERRTGQRRHAAAPRGRHAVPADPLGITVRPLRTADAVPDRALAGGRRPVTGSRRAPGTLPIEDWLLVGRARQQALLATLVAAGLALAMIPAAQRGDDPDPVNAAGSSPVVTAAAPRPGTERPVATGTPDRRGRPSAPEASRAPGKAPTSAPAASTPPPPTPAATEPPLVVVPPGDGPFGSWRTTGDATVALTFDDGPDPVQTPRILAMLAEYDVKATFCLVGVQVERHPEVVRQIAAAGHALCNHTWDHSLTIGRDEPEAIAADLARTNEAIRNAVPDAPVPFFRAPGGRFSDRLVQVAYRDGMTSLHWAVDPRDWEHEPGSDATTHVQKIVTEVRASVRPGAIVLSHDFRQPDTIRAYEELLPWLSGNFVLGVPAVPAPPADR